MRNPIYRAFIVSGVMQKMEDAARRSGAHDKLFKAVRQERSALRLMWVRGVIDYEQYAVIGAKLSRKLHARILRDEMRRIGLGKRRRATMTIRKACPPGMTAFDFRMGRAHVA